MIHAVILRGFVRQHEILGGEREGQAEGAEEQRGRDRGAWPWRAPCPPADLECYPVGDASDDRVVSLEGL